MTNPPESVRSRIVAAAAALQETGTVPIWHRQAIYAALGPHYPFIPRDVSTMSEKERQAYQQRIQKERAGMPETKGERYYGDQRTIGHKRRALLTIKAVEYPFAFQKNPDYYPETKRAKVEQLLKIAHHLLEGGYFNPKEVPPRISLFDAYGPDTNLWIAAGYAYDVITYDGDYDLDPLPPWRTDHELYGFRLDIVGILAAGVAYKKELPIFWDWWLTTAVPESYLAYPDPDPEALF